MSAGRCISLLLLQSLIQQLADGQRSSAAKTTQAHQSPSARTKCQASAGHRPRRPSRSKNSLGCFSYWGECTLVSRHASLYVAFQFLPCNLCADVCVYINLYIYIIFYIYIQYYIICNMPCKRSLRKVDGGGLLRTISNVMLLFGRAIFTYRAPGAHLALQISPLPHTAANMQASSARMTQGE